MKIGNFTIENPLALAPMVGVTDRFFRQLCRELGAGYVVTEMIAANPLLRDSAESRQRGDFVGEPAPFAVQIAGSEPRWMADAARYNVDRGAGIIDINMGCPAKKVCNKLAGSALLTDPCKVREILDAVVAAVAVPVFSNFSTAAKTNATREELNLLKRAIVGNPSAVSGGQYIDRGFEGDCGFAPSTLADLAKKPDSVALPALPKI
jgi:hypothetical protein